MDDPLSAVIRPLHTQEHRPACDLFHSAMHMPSVEDSDWHCLARSFEGSSAYGAFTEGRLIGVHQSLDLNVDVPGGQRVPASALGRFAVDPRYSRRGVGTALMHRALSDASQPLAVLRAAGGGIYSRYGFSVATRSRTVTVDRRHAVLRATMAETGRGTVQIIEDDPVNSLYHVMRSWVGSLARPEWYEEVRAREERAYGLRSSTVVYRDDQGVQGFARYSIRQADDTRSSSKVLLITDMHSRTSTAWASLWRFLLGVEQVDEVRAGSRPLDEPLELLFTNPRVCRTEAVTDELWLRLLDVEIALGLRQLDGDGEVVLEVHDALLPRNDGRFRIRGGIVDRTLREPDFSVPADVLGAVYLGDVSFSALASAGRLRVHRPEALPVADRLFATSTRPWCGTAF